MTPTLQTRLMQASVRLHPFGRGNVIAVIWKILTVVEQRFRRLNAPELMRAVYDGRKYEDWDVYRRLRKRSPPDVVYRPFDATSTGFHEDNIQGR